MQRHNDPLHQVLKNLYYFVLILTIPTSSLLLYQINDHDNVKDYVGLVFEGFYTHEINDVELIHQVQELFPHSHIHLRSHLSIEGVLQGIRDEKPKNVESHIDLVNLVVGRVQ